MKEAERIRRHSVLPRRQAQIYVLRTQYELSHGQIAEVLPISRSTSAEYTRRANDRLRCARWTSENLESVI